MSQSTKWFLIIIVLLALIGVGVTLLFYGALRSTSSTSTFTMGSGEKIAVVEIRDMILSSEETVRQLKQYREDRSIKAILLRIETPGGGVVPTQEMYEEVRRTRDSGKPVVVSMGSIAASGGYYIACGATKIVANRGTLTGSIGVVGEFLQLQDALNKLGIEVKLIKAGKLKDAGAPTRKMTAADEKYFQELMDEVHRQFMGVVEEERNLESSRVREIADGRVFTGEEAVRLGLVDTLGTYQDAVRIAADLAGISGEPALVKERKRRTFWDSVLGDVGEAARDIRQTLLDRPVLSYRYTGP